MKHSSIRNCQFTFCPTGRSPSKKFLSHIVCIDTLLRDKRSSYPVRRYSDRVLLRSLSEHERKPFGARSKRLWSTSQKASEQTANSIAFFCTHILLFVKRICRFQPHISAFVWVLCTCLLLSKCSSDPEIIPDDDETENPAEDSETEEFAKENLAGGITPSSDIVALMNYSSCKIFLCKVNKKQGSGKLFHFQIYPLLSES